MDAFYASVEQRDNFNLKGKPIAVGGGEERGVVAAASYEARKFGVRSAMSGYKAKQLCPEIIFVKPKFAVYKEVSKQIMQIFKHYTDLVEPLSLDEAYLDVTENKINQPLATVIANDIRKKIFEETKLTASAGISFNKFLAKVASDLNKPNGFAVITPQKAPQFIAQLPIEKFFGIGKKTAEKLKKLQIYNGADLQKLELLALEKKLGKLGVHLYHIVRGIDQRDVKPNRIRKSIGCETTLTENISELKEIESVIEQLAEELNLRLINNQSKGKTLTLKVKFNDFSIITRSTTQNHWIEKKEDILHLSKVLLRNEQSFILPIRLVGLQISNLNNQIEHLSFRQLEFPFKDQ